MANKVADVVVRNYGSIVLFELRSPAAREWVDENVYTEGWQWLGRSLGVDHRFAGQLTDGMIEAGLEVA
jgi:hypothetical protein